ncbi:MAG TPA: hypothetical protein VMS17_18765 [Gemmataceae bacterium]|nr:hypothetical protein [Gemmataceae bacterium]
MMKSLNRIPRFLLAVVVTAVATTAAHADRLTGPGEDRMFAPAHTTVRYTDLFWGFRPAVVTVAGERGRVLELQVYDADGNLVGSDTGDSCTVSWTPRRVGPYTIKVINRSAIPNFYDLHAD